MADNRQLEDIGRDRSDDSLILEEWMIIDDAQGDNRNKMSTSLESCSAKDNDENFGNVVNDTDISYEKDTTDKGDSDDAVEKLDDSDDISVITESDNEQLVVAKEISRIEKVSETSQSCTGIQKLNQADDKTVSQVGTIFNIIVACSLAAVIGLGAGRILSIDECTISNDVDFASVKMKNEFLINQLKELNGVRDVLDEIKASIPKATAADRKQSEFYSDNATNGKVNSKIFDKSSKKNRKTKINADSKIVERLKDSLENLCSVIDDIAFDKSRPFTGQLCQNQHVIKDLLVFEKIISEALRDSTEETSEIRVLQNAEERINNVCRSLLFDLSNSVHGIVTKIYRKLEKVSRQMNEKLCKLQKDAGSESFKKLASGNNLFANCEKMSNVTRNSDKSTKVDGVMKGTLKRSDKSAYNKRSKTWKNKEKSKSRKGKLEFLKKELYHSPEEDTCSSVQIPWAKLDSKNDFEFEKKLDAEEICTSTNCAKAKKFNLKGSEKMPKGFNTAHVKNSKNIWNKKIRDSKISKKDIEERRDSKESASSENLEDHSKDTYASKVKNSKNKMDHRKDESSYELDSNQEACSNGKRCLNEKRGNEKTDDNKDVMDSKSSKRNSKHKLVKRQGRPKMHESRADKINKDMHDGEWQLQRSKAREILRDREKASDWYFDRAGSRKDARKYEKQPEVKDEKNDDYDEEWEYFLFHTKDVRQFGKRDPNLRFSSGQNVRSSFKTHRENIKKERRR